MKTMTLKMNALQSGNLREHLDPIFLRTLQKRLMKGQISQKVFKETLKRMMIAQFFSQYSHPVEALGRKIKALLFMELRIPRRHAGPATDQEEPPHELEGYLAVPRSKHIH